MSACHETNLKVSHAIHVAKLVQMPSKKRIGRVRLSPATARRRSKKKIVKLRLG